MTRAKTQVVLPQGSVDTRPRAEEEARPKDSGPKEEGAQPELPLGGS